MGLIAKLGRYLVLLGLHHLGRRRRRPARREPLRRRRAWWQLSLVLTVIGTGAGLCFGTIFDTALGDVDADKASAASGSMSAVQQIAAAIGSASVTSVYFSTVKGSGQAHAMTTSLYVVLAITALSIGAVKLLPRHAAEHQH
jgi:drug/metabolite transporter (DMT)-like permease